MCEVSNVVKKIKNKNLLPFIHYFNTFESYYASTLFLSNGNMITKQTTIPTSWAYISVWGGDNRNDKQQYVSSVKY